MTLVDTETGEIVKPTLEACERVIEAGLATFIEVGNALLIVRDERLYKQAGYKTFESYCSERWRMERSHANRLMDSAQVVRVLSPMGDIPANERQARALSPLKDDPEALTEAWNEAQQRAEEKGRQVSARIIEEVVAEKAPPRVRSASWTGRSADRIASQVLANVKALADALLNLDVSEYRATQEDVEGLDRTIKALRKLRNSLVITE